MLQQQPNCVGTRNKQGRKPVRLNRDIRHLTEEEERETTTKRIGSPTECVAAVSNALATRADDNELYDAVSEHLVRLVADFVSSVRKKPALILQ